MKYRREKKSRLKKYLKAAIVIAVLYSAHVFFFGDKFSEAFHEEDEKRVFLKIDGFGFGYVSDAETVGDFLREADIEITENDFLYPGKDSKIFYGSNIYVKKARKVKVLEDGEKKEFHTLANFVGEAVRERSELKIGEHDLIRPNEDSYVAEGMEISITHVKIEKEKIEEYIPFKTISKEDDDLGWREKKVTTKGERGVKEVEYEVVYHDGKEIKRKKIEEKIAKDPVSEVVTQGTYVSLGNKVHTGLGTWYAQPKHLELRYPSASGYWAANPWLPMGSYAKVTNKANGKSVIVRINDRGPFGPNRIIDLGKPAFAAIASIGAGVIDVKMEEVKN